MEISKIIHIAIIIILTSLAIVAKQLGKKKFYYVLKPLTLLLIIALPLLEFRDEYSTYAYLIITGLVFSLLGDLYLLFPEKYFTNGLYSFLVAHILYILAFNQGVSTYCYAILVPIIVYIFIVTNYLKPKLGGMKYPVFGYILIISTMLLSALNMDFQFGEISFVAVGAILFTISDTTLAFNKFYKKFYLAEPIILSSYFIAQLFFAMSI
jgi:uncharacterized membrane protein YhhN